MKASSALALIVQEHDHKLCRHGLNDLVDLLGVIPVEDAEKGALRLFVYRCQTHKRYGLLVVEDGKTKNETPG